MTIPIQSPHIDPGLFQRPSGGEEGLAPLIQALEFYKTSKLQDERNSIEQQRANSETAFQKAQADTLEQNLQDRTNADRAWQQTVGNAPATLQPFLKAVDGLRGLDPALQQVVAPVLARQIPGFAAHPDPQALVGFGGLVRAGLPLGVAAKIYDVDLDGLGVPKSYQNWKYTPPGEAGADASRTLRAQGMVFSQAQKRIADIQKDVKLQQQHIAETVTAQRNGGRPPLPGVPVVFDPSDGQMVSQLHQYMAQKHYDVELQTLTRDRESARQQIQSFASPGATADPSTNRVQQIMRLAFPDAFPPDSSQ